MKILNQLDFYTQNHGQNLAIRFGKQNLTYQQLGDYSDRLAAYIQRTCGENKAPVIVYGHKGPFMIVCFLAAVKSGRPYCPLDISMPDSRVTAIAEMVNPSISFALEETGADLKRAVSLKETLKIVAETKEAIDSKYRVSGEDTFYIIFTSGSTGQPKGVEITENNLDHYLDWSVGLGTDRERKKGQVFLNQAPFSFDLSVMDLYTCLASGGTLYVLDKKTQMDFKALIPALSESGAGVWVSTPSFADMCMADREFNAELMPELEVFLFCGETLTNATAIKLMERFPETVIMNTYGPTESTVAVTEIPITRELANMIQPLPVGKAKPGTVLEIHKKDGSLAKPGESGEIIIVGDTVSAGYFRQKGLTRKAFFTSMREGKPCRAYRTGDKGYLDKHGTLFYQGRIDLQVKLNGYRIEIEDIEKNITRLDDISHAVVIPNMKDGKVKSLTAFVMGSIRPENRLQFSKEMREKLKALLPAYMIPKKIIHMESLPMNHNGKVDRKQLGGLA